MFAMRLFLKWLLFLLFKSAIVIVGPGALICFVIDWDFWGLKGAVEAHTRIVCIYCLIFPICLVDWIRTFLLPSGCLNLI